MKIKLTNVLRGKERKNGLKKKDKEELYTLKIKIIKKRKEKKRGKKKEKETSIYCKSPT